MAVDELQEAVIRQLSSTGAPAPVFSSVPVTVRLHPEDVAIYEVLAGHLGYSGRSALMRLVLEKSVGELIQLVEEALDGSPDRLAALQRDLGDTYASTGDL